MQDRSKLQTQAVDTGSVSQAPGDEAPSSARLGILWDGAAIALLVCTAIIVLAVPVFPSQDGPIHLYYVDILRSLLTHSGPYTQHFEIKSLLAPYALEYYSLLAFETVFSPEVSEKLLVCCYIFAFGLGFRYLVNSVAERRNPWTLAGIPFCMNAFVYLGFVNFSFGVALALFLSGLWIRSWGRLRPRRVAALLAGFILLLLTHPVPIAAFLVFAGLYFVTDLARAAATGSGLWVPSLRARWRPLAMIALMGGAAAVWVSMFVNHSQNLASLPSSVAKNGWIGAVILTLKLWPVTPFTAPSYRIGLVILLATTVLAILVSVWKHGGRVCSAAIAMIATSALCFTLVCIAPATVNGSGYLADRLSIFWLIFAIAAAAASRPPRRLSIAAGVIALCATCAVLPFQWVNTSRIARELRPALEAPRVQAGSVGLIIGDLRSGKRDLTFDPFVWGGAHYFRRSGAIMANAPWMDLPIIMIRPAHPDRYSYLNPYSAALSLSSAMNAGGAPPDLSLVMREGTPGAVTEAIISGLAWSPLTPNGGTFGIYSRPR